jgi:NAD(P)-dependent dehydrogenase (short-subunit alcohol dehydrogenase family)
MSAIDASELLRPGLLEGLSVLVAGPPAPPDRPSEQALRGAVSEACGALGAAVCDCCPISDRSELVDEAALDAAVAAALVDVGKIDLLAVDGAGLFAHGLASGGSGQLPASPQVPGSRPAPGSSHAALRTCMDAAWNVTRAVVNRAFLPPPGAEGQPTGARGGRIVYLAPGGWDGLSEYAGAACAGLENLARTLSIEWARHGVTAVTIAPGAGTEAGEVAALTAYLASPAGAYFSGCLLDLRGDWRGLTGGARRS